MLIVTSITTCQKVRETAFQDFAEYMAFLAGRGMYDKKGNIPTDHIGVYHGDVSGRTVAQDLDNVELNEMCCREPDTDTTTPEYIDSYFAGLKCDEARGK